VVIGKSNFHYALQLFALHVLRLPFVDICENGTRAMDYLRFHPWSSSVKDPILVVNHLVALY